MAPASEKFQGDGFVIENCIIKGDKEYYDVKENNLGELMLSALNETPEYIGQIAVSTGKRRTFTETKELSIRLAAWLRKEAVSPGDVVSLCAARHPDTDIILCSISFVGATYTAFAHNADVALARYSIKTVLPKITFAHSSIVATLREAAALENHAMKIVVIDDDSEDDCQSLNSILKDPLSEEIGNFQVTPVNSDDVCVIVSTSGTTGLPKFIPLTHKQVIHQALQFDIHKESDKRNQIILIYFRLGWLVHILFTIRSIIIRQTLVFHEEFEPHETCKIIEKYKVDSLAWEVYIIALLVESDVMNKYDLASVTCIHSVGSKLFDQVRGKMLDIFPNVRAIGRGLGILETGLLTLFTKNCRNPESEGAVVPNVQLKFVDTVTGQPLGHNVPGELCVKSPCMITAYYKDPQATRAAFDKDGWYHTGDEAYYDENGEIIFVGRLKEIIRYRRVELHPLLIEHTLLSHPNIVDAAVVGIYDKLNVEQPVAFVKTTKSFTVTEADVLKLTSYLEQGDIFKDRVIFTDEIPRNANGKINRRVLRARAEKYYKSY